MKSKILLLLILAAFLVGPNNANSQANVQDSLALVDLYNSTNGKNWYAATNWLTSEPLYTWRGILVDADNRVADVNLGLNNLRGNLPASIGNLQNLLGLELPYNSLTGNIPNTIGQLSKLETLSLTSNNLNGGIPVQLCHLKNLSLLYLDQNQLNGPIPDSIGNLVNLFYVYLDHNLLTGSLPGSMGNLANLHILRVSENLLSGEIPAGLVTNANISTMYISKNKYTFNGAETVAGMPANDKAFLQQDTTLPLHQGNHKLSVSAGGTLSNNTYTWYTGRSIDTLTATITITGDSTYAPPVSGYYMVTVTNAVATHLTFNSDTVFFNAITDSTILPARPATEFASYEYTDTAGWTHYYYNNNTPNDLTDDTLLLSLKKNGQDIGTIGDGTFSVKLVATSGAGSNTGIHLTNPLITNSSGYWVMNRYWQVTPTREPGESVGVRFYYNNKDLADVNGSYPNHNLTNDKLIFYKTVGGNPDPTTNLAGATAIISIMPGTAATDTTWTYHALSDTTQYGEYSVASFSGGGGGGTGNNQALPVVLVSFMGNLAKNDVQLNWQTAQEINAGYYTVERSLTGRDYTAIGRINAAGNSTITQAYKLTDYNAPLLGSATLYYRLKISDKNGYTTYSNVIAVDIAGGVSGLLVYPNPAKNTATVIFYANAVGKYAIEISNVGGKTISRTEGLSAEAINKVIVDLHGYPQGAYIITLKGTNIKQQNITLLKQ